MKILLLKEKSTITINELALDKKIRDYWFVGRDPQCHLVVCDPKISRIHCTIVCSNAIRRLFNRALTCSANGFLLLDGNFGNPRSTHGVFVDGTRTYRHFISNQINSAKPVLLGDSPYSLVFQFPTGENKKDEENKETLS